MALGAAQRITDAGVEPSMATPAASDSFSWPGTAPYVRMRVNNGSGGAITATVTSEANPSDGLVKDNKVVSIPAGAEREFRISQAFRDSSDSVAVAFSGTTSVTAGVFYE